MTPTLRLTGKPRANVTHGVLARAGWVHVWCDDRDAREAAVTAAATAGGPWVLRDTDAPGHTALRVVPPAAHLGHLTRATREVRDAAARTLREHGYSLRGRAGT